MPGIVVRSRAADAARPSGIVIARIVVAPDVDNESMTIEAMDFHRYLVSMRQDGDPIEVVVELTPEAVADAGLEGDDDLALVRATIIFLTSRQRADELPANLAFEGVVAAYPDFADAVRADLAR